MEYVEVLRARRLLFWGTGALIASTVVTLVSILYSKAQGHIVFVDGGETGSGPFAALLIGCASGALLAATFAAPGLAAEHTTVPLLWTRPFRRDTIAWRYVAVDLIAVSLMYVLTVLAAIVMLAVAGAWRYVAFGPETLPAALLGLAAAWLFYALVVLVSAQFPSRGSLIAGLSWAAFIAVGTLGAAPLPQPLHALASALSVLNPLAYLSVEVGSSGRHGAVWVGLLPLAARAALAFALAAVALVAAVRLWSTREAQA